jgi:uncharacterized membrane protein
VLSLRFRFLFLFLYSTLLGDGKLAHTLHGIRGNWLALLAHWMGSGQVIIALLVVGVDGRLGIPRIPLFMRVHDWSFFHYLYILCVLSIILIFKH